MGLTLCYLKNKNIDQCRHFICTLVILSPLKTLAKLSADQIKFSINCWLTSDIVLFTSREAARSREGVVLPGEEEDVCLKKGVFCFLVHGSFIIWSFMVTVMLFGYVFQKKVKKETSINIFLCFSIF